jgi:hypothetical protein
MKYLIFIANQYVQHTSLQRPYTPKYPVPVQLYMLAATSASHPYMPKGAGTTGSSYSKIIVHKLEVLQRASKI